MKLTAAVLLQLAGFVIVLHFGPWGLLPGAALLISGGRLYRLEQRTRPAAPLRRRMAFFVLSATALVLGALVSVNPWKETDAYVPTAMANPVPTLPGSPACVFVLHGLARPSATETLAAALRRTGFDARSVIYRSTSDSFEGMVERLAQAVSARSSSCRQLDFVGYSLGALVIRAYLGESPPAQLGRVVMIAPPNQGSELADHLGAIWLFRRAAGAVAAQLGTAADSLPRRLPAPRYPLGIIAGDRASNPLGWLLIAGPHDGTVSVASTRLDGMSDFLLVHRTHHFIVRTPEVAAQTAAFLRNGRFNR